MMMFGIGLIVLGIAYIVVFTDEEAARPIAQWLVIVGGVILIAAGLVQLERWLM